MRLDMVMGGFPPYARSEFRGWT